MSGAMENPKARGIRSGVLDLFPTPLDDGPSRIRNYDAFLELDDRLDDLAAE